MAEPHESNRNSSFSLKGIVKYANKLYRLFDGFRALKDSRAANHCVELADAFGVAFMMLLTGKESMNRIFGARLSGGNTLKNCMLSGPNARVPSRSTVERILAQVDPWELKQMIWSMCRKAVRNGALKDAEIDGHTIGIVDGIQIYSSQKKKCDTHCQIAVHRNGTETYSHKMTVLSTPCLGGDTGHLVLSYTFLGPRDPGQKQEGELTGGKRLMQELKEQMPGTFDIVTGDALYGNAPSINAVRAAGAQAVVRLKDDDRLLKREADEKFDHGRCIGESFLGRDRDGNMVLVMAQHACFEMAGVPGKVRVVRFTELPVDHDGKLLTTQEKGQPIPDEETSYMISTDLDLRVTTIWKVKNIRWDIENSCFHVLTTDFHIKHLYSHMAAEQITALTLIAFNLRNLYLFRFRKRDFVGKGYALWDVTDSLKQDLYRYPIASLLSGP